MRNSLSDKLLSFFVKRPYIVVTIVGIILPILFKSIFVPDWSYLGSSFLFLLIFMLGSLIGLTAILVNANNNRIRSMSYMMDRIKNKDLDEQVLNLAEVEGLEDVSASLKEMIIDMRGIMLSFNDISKQLLETSDMFNSNYEKVNTSIDDISITMNEIARGASEQASEAEKGVNMIMSLSEQINNVSEHSSNVAESSKDMIVLNSRGITAINSLKEANEESSDTTNKISEFMRSFIGKSKEIGEFVTTINTIATQTNLLALNAAIEAARAGEAGLGFAVVADEVRKLADNSKKATDQIESIMEGIIREADHATEILDRTSSVMELQSQAVDNTIKTFQMIADGMDVISNRIDQVVEATKVMDESKNNAITAIQNISAVSEEAAASSQEVAANTQEQREIILSMTNSAKELNTLSQELRKYVERYKL
jgi:methyl-accepting chemotaxis protein